MVDVEDGGEVILPCDARGGPKPSVTWTKDGKILQSSDTNTTLQIANIELKDQGVYVCTARNPAGSAAHSVLVRVVRCKLVMIMNTFFTTFVFLEKTHETNSKFIT